MGIQIRPAGGTDDNLVYLYHESYMQFGFVYSILEAILSYYTSKNWQVKGILIVSGTVQVAVLKKFGNLYMLDAHIREYEKEWEDDCESAPLLHSPSITEIKAKLSKVFDPLSSEPGLVGRSVRRTGEKSYVIGHFS